MVNGAGGESLGVDESVVCDRPFTRLLVLLSPREQPLAYILVHSIAHLSDSRTLAGLVMRFPGGSADIVWYNGSLGLIIVTSCSLGLSRILRGHLTKRNLTLYHVSLFYFTPFWFSYSPMDIAL